MTKIRLKKPRPRASFEDRHDLKTIRKKSKTMNQRTVHYFIKLREVLDLSFDDKEQYYLHCMSIKIQKTMDEIGSIRTSKGNMANPISIAGGMIAVMLKFRPYDEYENSPLLPEKVYDRIAKALELSDETIRRTHKILTEFMKNYSFEN